MGAFGVPVQDVEAQGAATTTGNGTGAAASEVVDLNDPRLSSEVITDNSEANAFATVPPIPAGKYRAKVTLQGFKGEKGEQVPFKGYMANWIQPPVPYIGTMVSAEVLDADGKYDGYHLSSFVKSLPVRHQGTSQFATIARYAGVQTPAQATPVQYAQLLQKGLAAEPEMGIEVDWEWQCETCRDRAEATGGKKPKALVGMHKFPNGKVVGTKDPQMKCEACGTYSQAQPRIIAFLPLGDIKR